MQKYKFIILGAGPTGLSVAHTLLASGVDRQSILVLEKDSTAGGLCRSADVDGSPLDIGGGHFLDIRNREVTEFLFRFMPRAEWNRFDRIAKIRIFGQQVDHPLEANLWQLPVEQQIDFLESLARNNSAGLEMPDGNFESWIRAKLGDRLAEAYMLPYNRKIWDFDLNLLGTYWLHKLPSVSFREVLTSCLERRATGTLPAHAEFLYPKSHGYGEVWRRMGVALGESLLLDTPANSVDFPTRTVNGCFQAEYLVNTVPWQAFVKTSKLPPEIASDIADLVHTSVDVDYHPSDARTDAHWLYEPDESISYHRILARQNFCPGSNGYWTETNSRRSLPADGFRHTNEFAYPVNTLNKPKAVSRITAWARRNNVFAAGRWGLWEHMNSDVAVKNGIDLANTLIKEAL